MRSSTTLRHSRPSCGAPASTKTRSSRPRMGGGSRNGSSPRQPDRLFHDHPVGQSAATIENIIRRSDDLKKLILIAGSALLVIWPVSAQDISPTCRMCPGTYIPLEEIQAYMQRGAGQAVSDQQV